MSGWTVSSRLDKDHIRFVGPRTEMTRSFLPAETYAEIWRLSKEVLKKDGTPNLSAIGRLVGASKDAVFRTLQKPELQNQDDHEIFEAAKAGGISDPRNLSHFWKIAKDADGNGYSLFVKNPRTGQDVSIYDLVRESILDTPIQPIKLEKRIDDAGEHLLVVDLADVHFLKLCVKSETGHT